MDFIRHFFRRNQARLYDKLDNYAWWNERQKDVLEQEINELIQVQTSMRNRMEYLSRELLKRGGPSQDLIDLDPQVSAWWGEHLNPFAQLEEHQKEWKW